MLPDAANYTKSPRRISSAAFLKNGKDGAQTDGEAVSRPALSATFQTVELRSDLIFTVWDLWDLWGSLGRDPILASLFVAYFAFFATYPISSLFARA